MNTYAYSGSGSDDRDENSVGSFGETVLDITPSSYSHSFQPVSQDAASLQEHIGGYCNVRPAGRPSVKRPCYNRGNIKMEEFIMKNPESITAKEHRVLIPVMFQSVLHPNKETQKTKVKGLWEQGNQPPDWPQAVKFRDPNNVPKFRIEESKVVFQYLKDKLVQICPKFYKYQQPVKTEPVFPGPLKFNRGYTPVNPGHSVSSSNHGYDTNATCHGSMNLGNQTALPPVPTTIQHMDEASVARDQGVTLKMEPLSPESSVPYTQEQVICFTDDALSTIEANKAVEVIYNPMEEDPAATMVTPQGEFTELQNIGQLTVESTTSQMISVVNGEESGMFAVNPEGSCGSIQAVTVENAQEESEACTEFANGIQDRLIPIVKNFSVAYDSNNVVMEKVTSVFEDTFVPMFNAAKSNKTMCAELSKLGGSLREMLERFSFMKNPNDADDSKSMVEELDKLQSVYQLQQVVNVPEPSHEVQVMTVTEDTHPCLMDESNPYIPTIDSLTARAQQKQLDIEQGIDSSYLGEKTTKEDCEKTVAADKVGSLMSPMMRGMEEMNLDNDDIQGDPENDHGITLKPGFSTYDEPDTSSQAPAVMKHNEDKLCDPKEEPNSPPAPIDIAKLLNDINILNTAHDLPWEDLGIEQRPIASTEPETRPSMTVVVPTQPQAQPSQTKGNEDFFDRVLDGECDSIDEAAMSRVMDALMEKTLAGFQPDETGGFQPDENMFLDSVIGLEEDYPKAEETRLSSSSSFNSLDVGPSPVASYPNPTQVSAPRTVAQVVTQPSSTKSHVSVPSPASPPSHTELMAKLRSMMMPAGSATPPVIPTTVLEAAANPMDREDLAPKRRSSKPRSSRRNSDTAGPRHGASGSGKHRATAVNAYSRLQPYN